MIRSALIVAALVGSTGVARADAHEASLHVQAIGGVVSLGDPGGGDPSQVVSVGGAARFTWASRDWLAWEVEAYGAGTTAGSHVDVDTPRGARDYSRRAVAAGLDIGASLRLGVAVIPTLALALGPQLRLRPATPLLESGTGRAVGDLGAATEFDLTARVSAGVDLRVNARWVVGIRGSAREALGLDGGSWRSFEGTLHASYYWYPRWWSL